MKITLIQTGKSHFGFVDDGFSVFEKRIKNYCRFEIATLELPSRLKSSNPEQIKKNEAELILKKVSATDFLILLDENGKAFRSTGFANYLQKLFISQANIVFVIGGAYGFADEVYKRANFKLSLSQMTFSHQLIRVLFAEQLYRAFSIIKGEPYHHE